MPNRAAPINSSNAARKARGSLRLSFMEISKQNADLFFVSALVHPSRHPG
jgi:hypothetical protein